tara:strand:- start:227 stop:871 length:645 start_codon:yes stop_codon:yes gene_type:complete
MKHLLAIAFITLLALGTGCAWISPTSETTSDGIKVHGHWTVTVTNPDGTVDAVHEFENEFVKEGLLTNLLSGKHNIIGSYFRLKSESPEKLSCLEQFGTTLLDKEIVLESQMNIEQSIGLPFSLSATCTALTTPPEQSQTIDYIFTDFRAAEWPFCKWIPAENKTLCAGTTVKHASNNNTYNFFTSSLTRHHFEPALSVWNTQQISFNVKISIE